MVLDTVNMKDLSHLDGAFLLTGYTLIYTEKLTVSYNHIYFCALFLMYKASS